MNIFQAVILGIVQGIAEFLPISSSGHLVIVPFLFGWNIPENFAFPFDIMLHLGTLAAVVIYFWKDLLVLFTNFLQKFWKKQSPMDPQVALGWYIVLATIPAVILGVLIKDIVEAAFSLPAVCALFLFGTALLLFFGERKGTKTRIMSQMTWLDALWIGLAQALAIFPGLSRAGATISAGVFRGLKREDAARFSFLLSIPALLGSAVFGFKGLFALPGLSGYLPVLIAGFLTSAVVGYFSINWLLKFLVRQSMTVFSIYCVVIGLVTLGKYFIFG